MNVFVWTFFEKEKKSQGKSILHERVIERTPSVTHWWSNNKEIIELKDCWKYLPRCTKDYK